jgi:cohesin complex subunit SCC1
MCRGVAKYLKTLFDKESGLGRKSVAIDRLLNGKTRKEASRMFFETLVGRLLIYLTALS